MELPSAYAEAAVRAARLVGLELAGVDMLEGREGPRLMELNSSPGFEGLEKATGQDIAGALVDHALAFAQTHRPSPHTTPGPLTHGGTAR
jgi:ribosomal protein S6--L-glutamate ligase